MLGAAIMSAAAVAGSVQSTAGAIEASFGERSYRPADLAYLSVRSRVAGMRLRVFRCGPPALRTYRSDRMSGAPVTDSIDSSSRRIPIRVGDWPSGLYFVRIEGAGGKVGFAPFVVRPRRLGASRVAVVLPTNTWQAYNFRDDNHDGVGDTWYADSRIRSIDLTRPFLNHGVPPNFSGYNEGFLWWLALHDKEPDVLADDDFERVRGGADLARLYDLVIFAGHEEYVTAHTYDVVQSYRDRGGNLAFLSANNFYYRVERHGRRLHKIGHWSDAGRTGERLGGEVYVGWSKNRFPNQPYRVTGASRARWFFVGTGLRNGKRFGKYGIEIDQRGPNSPRNIVVLARIANDFGPGRSAEMTYYATPAGAKVFSAGAMNFGGSALWPAVSRMLENLWEWTSRP
ncbi:MAG: N,N-dimethylformamidase beta subunit family domain-containing protein [Gaiellaceae bacterium]